MPVLTVESEQRRQFRCIDCGGISHRARGYVHADDAAYGAYFLDWCEGTHDTRIAWLTLSLGRWGEGTSGSDRSVFAIEWREGGMAFLPEPVIDRPGLLGEFVPRAAALAMPDAAEAWHVADHLVLEDAAFAEVQRWLDRGEPASS